jgi:hypothetical protein
MRRSTQIMTPLLTSAAMAFVLGHSGTDRCDTTPSAPQCNVSNRSPFRTIFGGFGQSFSDYVIVMGTFGIVVVGNQLTGGS